MRTVTWPAVIAVLLGLVIPLQAQQGQGAMASAPEAMALLRAGPLSRAGETVEFLSTLPPAFPKELLPEGATVETAATSPSITVVVSRVRPGTPFSLGDFSWKVERAGWIANGPMPAGFGMPGERAGSPVALCKSGQFVSVQLQPTASGDRLLRTAVTTESNRSCAPNGGAAYNDIPMPRFVLPAGVGSNGGGGGGSSNDNYQSAQLTTSMPSDVLAKSFSDQLVAEGWKLAGQPVSDDTMTVERLTALSRVGDPLTGVLIVTTLGPNSVDAYFRVVRNKPVR